MYVFFPRAKNRKIFKTIPSQPESETMYIRYVLVYRLWKRIHNNKVVKERIINNALSTLGTNCLTEKTALAYMDEGILPKSSEPSEMLATRFYLCHQAFDDRKACEKFLEKYKRVEEFDEGDRHGKTKKVQRVSSDYKYRIIKYFI